MKSTTLQPVENRIFDATDPECDDLYQKSMVHSSIFWLTHWSIRLGLHSMITEMNSYLNTYLGQLERQLREAEAQRDEGRKRRIEVAIHYVLVRMYTTKAIVSSENFRSSAILLFKISMEYLTRIATDKPELLSQIPEFLAQNMNDVIGLLDRYSAHFLEECVSSDFITVTFDYCVLYMSSSKCAFNPHLRKDIGPMLAACCPFAKGRRGDGRDGASIRLQGQVRHLALADYNNKKGLVAAIIGIFCDCEYITEDDGFDSKLNFRLPFYTLLEGYIYD